MINKTEYTGTHILEKMKEAVNYNQFLLKRIIKTIPVMQSNQALFDFGAGIGTFAELLHQHGYKVYCIEYDEELRNDLKKQGYRVYKTPDEIILQSVRFIYSLNVLEHIEKDEEVLRALHHILDQNGLLYLYVPAFNILYSTMDKKVGHLRRYRYRQLKQKLEKAGFTLVKWQYVDSIGFFLSLVYRWIGDESGELSIGTLKFYDRVLFPFSKILDFFLKKCLGKNLEIIAKK